MPWNEILASILRSTFAIILLLCVTRFMGRKAISQMTFFDFAVGITIGSVTASLAVSVSNSIYSTVSTLATLALLTVLIDLLHIKSIKFSKLVESEPVVLVANGKINDHNMRRTRSTIEDLNTLLREKNVFNIADVEFAIMENDGKLSVLPKSQKQPVTPSDLNIPTSYKGLTRDIIIDGEILNENLKDASLDKKWLIGQLDRQGIQDIRDVFYAGLDTSGGLYVSKRHRNEGEKHGKYGTE